MMEGASVASAEKKTTVGLKEIIGATVGVSDNSSV